MKGATHFERAGTLWAKDQKTGVIMTVADMKLTQQCDSCGQPVTDCDRQHQKNPENNPRAQCNGAVRRAMLETSLRELRKRRQASLEKLEKATEQGVDQATLNQVTREVLHAFSDNNTL